MSMKYFVMMTLMPLKLWTVGAAGSRGGLRPGVRLRIEVAVPVRRQGIQGLDFDSGERGGGAHYDPDYGYEPYWAGGHWVFAPRRPRPRPTTPRDDTDGSTLLMQQICGQRCSRMYIEYGEICGRNRVGLYTTFENYCEMRDRDCDNRFGWMVAYRGACRGPVPVARYNVLRYAPRYDAYIAQFLQRRPPTTRADRPPTGTPAPK